MTKILWSEGLKTGVSTMDTFHSSFVELINEFEEEIIAKSSLKTIKSLLTDIYDLARTGFQQEEDIMEQYSFAEYNSRMESHQRFLAELEFFLQERLKAADDESYYECYDFLYSWFFKHVLEDDAKLVRHLEDINFLKEAA